jgi:hypothetical protein
LSGTAGTHTAERVAARIAAVVSMLAALLVVFLVRLDVTWGHRSLGWDHAVQLALAAALLGVGVWGWKSRAGGRAAMAVAVLALLAFGARREIAAMMSAAQVAGEATIELKAE